MTQAGRVLLPTTHQEVTCLNLELYLPREVTEIKWTVCALLTHTRAIAFIRSSQESGGSHQATTAKRCVLGSTEGRPRPANRPESRLGLPALSSRTAR